MSKNKKAEGENKTRERKKCAECGANAEVDFIYGGESLAASHGFTMPLCKKCYVEEVIAGHEEVTKNLYELLREAHKKS